MMNLDQQLQILIQEAPNYGVPSQVMQQAVTPVLKLFAEQLQHREYYLLQNSQGNWLLTTLSHRQKSNLEKKVIYAFATVNDAMMFVGTNKQELRPIPLPIADILFQLFALKPAESMVFMETPGNFNQGVEVVRADLQKLIEEQIKNLVKVKKSNIPPNIA